MAEAHAQLTGRPAACLGTRAVGASNLAIGIHTAFADSSPMFVLVGQVARASRGREGFQEVNLVGSPGGLAKWAAEPADVEEAVAAVAEAVLQATSGRPGPVLLALAEDLLDEIVPAGSVAAAPRGTPQRPTDDEVRDVLQLLSQAERPVILAGVGVLRARTSNDLLRLAELLRVPVIASWRRGDVISNDNPLYLGMTGNGSPPAVPRAPCGCRRDARHRLTTGRDLELRLDDPGEQHALGPRGPRAGETEPGPCRPPICGSPRTRACSSVRQSRGSRPTVSSMRSTPTRGPRRTPRIAPPGRPPQLSTTTRGLGQACIQVASSPRFDGCSPTTRS